MALNYIQISSTGNNITEKQVIQRRTGNVTRATNGNIIPSINWMQYRLRDNVEAVTDCLERLEYI